MEKIKIIPKKNTGLSPSKCMSKSEWIDLKKIFMKWGYKPNQFKIQKCK